MHPLRSDFDRRDFLRFSLAATLGVSWSGWFPNLARAAEAQRTTKSCILLWMAGGPSQTDTFDLKPGHKNGGPVKPIATSVPGIQIAEHFQGLAKQMQDMAIVRSLTTPEGDHDRATTHLLTGYKPRGGNLNYPVLGSLLAKELGSEANELPNYVSISPFRFAQLGSGFLGPQYSPLTVSGNSDDPSARANLTIENLLPSSQVTKASMENRFGLLKYLQGEFTSQHKSAAADSHVANYEKAMRMVRTQAKHAFDLDEEPTELRDAYGRNRFGQGCLLARRLVERGVPFVEVSLSQTPDNGAGWDTHADNFNGVRSLCQILDPGWSTLMNDLRDRGLLDSTLVLWMGEFGRTPVINENAGRDHFPAAWSTVLCGAGIQGGQAYGSTGEDGEKVTENPVTVPQLYATICKALDINPAKENISPEGRPIGLVDEHAEPVAALLKTSKSA